MLARRISRHVEDVNAASLAFLHCVGKPFERASRVTSKSQNILGDPSANPRALMTEVPSFLWEPDERRTLRV